MEISSEITLWGITFYTQGLFLILGLLFSLYALWKEGRKDGFDEERLFDKYVLSILVGLLVSRLFYAVRSRYLFVPMLSHVFSIWRPGLNLYGFILGFVCGAVLFSRIIKWSVYRILDIFSLALAFGTPISIFGYIALQKDFTYLIVVGVLWIFYGLFSTLRLKKLFSGVTFAFFLALVIAGRVFLGFTEKLDLIFYSILFTIGTVVLILRITRNKMSAQKNLPQSFIDAVKNALLRKHENIEKQEKLLEEEDPYMKEGRAEGNSENVDEAYLEDTFKNIIDAQKNVLNSVKNNVKKALGKLDKGEYGTCESCGEPIDKARLEAYPEASLCTECARKSEAS